MMPYDLRHLIPVSLYCDVESYELVVNVYDEIAEGAGKSNVKHLNSFVSDSSHWGQLSPLILGPYWGILTRTITPQEATDIARIGLNFFYDASLGMLISKKRDLIFLRINPTRRNGIFLPGATIQSGFDVEYAKCQMAKHGWKTEKY